VRGTCQNERSDLSLSASAPHSGRKHLEFMQKLPKGLTFFERGWLSSNNILLQDDSTAVLIDSGYWTHAEQTQQLVSDALKNQPLSTLINTHLHSDHCGGNAALQRSYPNLRTLIPPGHADFVDVWDAQALTYTPTGQHCPPFQRSGILKDGDCFSVNGMVWRVYAAPGHDPHAIVLYNEEAGVLISADALWENGFGVVFPEIEGLDAFDEVASTLQIIEALGPRWVLPGHGPGFGNVEAALVRARSRLAQFRAAPDKHALYAAKVLLKFKLLELQKIRVDDFCAWGKEATYLQTLWKTYASHANFENWFESLCVGLEKSSACLIVDGHITNI
jgi:glyoxylase-like metal-dependent hydrolase (beta-lactamase superfamily II)